MEENIINKEFKVLGHSMENISIFYGFFLIIWGVAISFVSNSDSLTSFIPSFFGLPILIFAFLTIKYQEKKKLFMHSYKIVCGAILTKMSSLKQSNYSCMVQNSVFRT